jgi:hypothetical protein
MKDLEKQETRLMLEAFEIECLNIENLDVEELEQRLELTSGAVTPMGWICDCDHYTCPSFCGCNGYTCTTFTCDYDCSYDCSGDCSADVPIEI